MRKQRFMDVSLFICPECGKSIPLMRNHGKHRGKKHIKDIWCPYCKGDRKFKEIQRGDWSVVNGKTVYM